MPMHARMGERWESVNGLKPLVLAIVFVLAITAELAVGIDGISAGARAVVWAALAALAWELVPRAVGLVRRDPNPG
jgi:hypothetical protein